MEIIRLQGNCLVGNYKKNQIVYRLCFFFYLRWKYKSKSVLQISKGRVLAYFWIVLSLKYKHR